MFMDYKCIINMSVLLKATSRFNAIPIKTPNTFFSDLEKQLLKVTWKYKGPQIGKQSYATKKLEASQQNKFQNILQGSYNQNSLVLAKKYRGRLVKQNRNSRSQPRPLQPTYV